MTRTILTTVLLSAMLTSPLVACPFCSGVTQTFSEEIQMMDVAVICQLQKIGIYRPEDNDNPQGEVPKSTFVITSVIKGDEYIAVGDTFKCVYFGEDKKERPFLATATDAPKLQWSTPLILTDRAEKYLGLLQTLNANRATELAELKEKSKQLRGKGPTDEKAASKEQKAVDAQLKALESELTVQRLEFFQNYLEDEDEMLALDAYDEFAKAPYADVKALKPKMDHGRLIDFLNDTEVPSNRRRLYFTMLGVCGSQADAAMLEQFMLSGDRKKKAGLDAMLACYLILTGDEGLLKVEDEFLKNKDAEYADTYAAIMAIRFHGSEVDFIPRARLTKALHYMLDRPELADLVIPDLARWEDWSVIPKLVDLFATADENSSWVRVPVVNYLRACPLPVAKTKIEMLKTIDSDAVKRAMSFFPIEEEPADETAQPAESEATQLDQEETGIPISANKPKLDAIAAEVSVSTNVEGASLGIASSPRDVAQTKTAGQITARAKDPKSVVSIVPPDTLNQVESNADKGPNFWKLLGVMLLSASACFLVMRTALGIQS